MKIVLVGDSGVGKSAFVKRIRNGYFENKYIPTMGVEVFPFKYINNDKTNFILWDTAGQEKYGGLKEGYYNKAFGGIVMFDTTNKISYKNVPYWIDCLRKINPNLPIVVCGNKVDIPKYRKVNFEDITIQNEYKNVKYFDLSVKSMYNYEKPFEYFKKINNKNNNEIWIDCVNKILIYALTNKIDYHMT